MDDNLLNACRANLVIKKVVEWCNNLLNACRSNFVIKKSSVIN